MLKRMMSVIVISLVAGLLCNYNQGNTVSERDVAEVSAAPVVESGAAADVAQEEAGQAEAAQAEAAQAEAAQAETVQPETAQTETISAQEQSQNNLATLSESETEDAAESEYAHLAIAVVNDYVNVRSLPGTDGEIVGKMYDGAVAQIIETAEDEACEEWFHVTSGNVEGYIKAEYFLYGDAAAAVVEDYVTRYAKVNADRLNIRSESSADAKRMGYLDNGEKAKVLEDLGEWLKVQYGTKTGYIAAEYVAIIEEFTYAKSIEEERAEEEARRALEQRNQEAEEQTPENITVTAPPATYSSNSELRSQIVEYAKQFLGVKYVHGGNSLTEGTDCSGFTSLIYAEFGYSLSRTPAGQLSDAGRSIEYSEIQPGDIICYGSDGKCTHVALYIGDGQIIHEANRRKGVVIYQADYDTILGVKNVID